MERQGHELEATWAVGEIKSWRRNLEEGGRLEYETKWEGVSGDGELTWEPAESFTGGGEEILREFQDPPQKIESIDPLRKRSGYSHVSSSFTSITYTCLDFLFLPDRRFPANISYNVASL